MTGHADEGGADPTLGDVWPPAPTGQERLRRRFVGPSRPAGPSLPGTLVRALVAGACIGTPLNIVTLGVGAVFFCVSLWMVVAAPGRPWSRAAHLASWAAALAVGFLVGLVLGPLALDAAHKALPPDWAF